MALLVLAVGFLIRLWAATSSFVNPDEAYHALLASPDTFSALYESAVRSPHPPLFLILLHFVREITRSDLGIRFIPLVAGTLLPWVMYRWISRGWSRMAGFTALTILALAPELIRLSAEARAYTLCLLAMAVAIYLLDRAIEQSSIWKMMGFALALYVAILTDYSAAFFVLASGVYFLLRIREQTVTTGVRITWEFSQVGAVVLYSILWVTQVYPMQVIATTRADVEGWLRNSYPQPGQNPLVFIVQNTARQFAFLLPLLVPAVVAMALFAIALWLLWRRGAPGRFWHSRAAAVLMVTPFAAACAASFVHLFPYGRTRHTVFLALFIALGVGIAMDRVARNWIIPLAIVAAIAAPLWHAFEGRYRWEIGRVDSRKELMVQALDFMKRSIPPGTPILTESEFRVVLAYYLDTGVRLPEVTGSPSEERTGDYRLFCARWDFVTLDDLRQDLRLFRGRYDLGPDARIWVLDGGFRPLLEPAFVKLQREGELPDLFRFGRAMVAALTPPGFMWEEPRPEDRLAPEQPVAGALQPAVPEYR